MMIIYFSRYLIPPPPTAATHPPTPVRQYKLDSPTPAPRAAPKARTPAAAPQTDDPVLNFLQRLKDGFNTGELAGACHALFWW